MLAQLFAGDERCSRWRSMRDRHGAYLIDRSPHYFEPLLNYLRYGKVILDDGVNPEGVLEEARYFQLDGAIAILEKTVTREQQRQSGEAPLSRRDVVSIMTRIPASQVVRLQALNLTGGPARLDLQNANLQRHARGANLSHCMLDHCVLTTRT